MQKGLHMFYKITQVEALSDYILRVSFQNGKTKYYNVAPLFSKWEAFEELRDNPSLFKSVKVDDGGYGIVWNDSLDLECNDLWEYGFDTLPITNQNSESVHIA